MFSALNNALSKQGEKWIQNEYKTNTWVSSQPVAEAKSASRRCLFALSMGRGTYCDDVICQLPLPDKWLNGKCDCRECSCFVSPMRLSAVWVRFIRPHMWLPLGCVCVCLFVWGAYCIECDLGQNMLRFFTFRNGKAEVNSVYTTAKYPVVSCDKIRQVIYAQLTLFGLLYL